MRIRGDELWLLAVVTTAIFAVVAWSLGLVPEPPRPRSAAPPPAVSGAPSQKAPPAVLAAQDAG